MSGHRSSPTRRGVSAGLGAVSALGAAGSGAVSVAPITVTGPIPGRAVLDLGAYDLAPFGYVVEEFFFSGTAVSYKAAVAPNADGRWAAEPTGATAPYTTRLVVVRPTDLSKFNGSVLAEWLNVSGGRDGGPDWTMTHREILRTGAGYVGVSVQKVGVEGGPSLIPSSLPLKKSDPQRYASLTHPGDTFAYDIFSQAGRAIRGMGSAKVLGPLTAKHVLAAGESQSAGYMTTYANAIDPLVKVYHGILIHSRSGFATPIQGGTFGAQGMAMAVGSRIRTDVRIPVMTVLTETDVAGFRRPGFPGPTGYWTARQPDTDRIRTWEVPGTAHADTYMVGAGALDSGPSSMRQVAAAASPKLEISGMTLEKLPNSNLAHHYVMAAAYAGLERWVRSGQAPAHGTPIATTAPAAPDQGVTLVTDEHGNARGGVRTPWMDVPVARLAGTGNGSGGFGFLIGVTEPFDAAKLARLYPGGREDYLQKFDAALASAAAAGFILSADQADIHTLAADMYPA